MNSTGAFGGHGRRKAQHGTNSGYAEHIKYGIPIPLDDPCGCRAAHNEYNNANRALKRQLGITRKS